MTEEISGSVDVDAARRLHGLLDAPDPLPEPGDPLPPLWHWLTFLPSAPQREMGDDGHPRLGGFMPPTDLPRRMFAGGRYTFVRDIAVGEPLVRRSSIAGIDDKQGRSGRLRFVTVRHEILADDELALVEEQDLVYREASTGGPAQPAGGSARTAGGSAGTAGGEAHEAVDWPLAWQLEIDPVVLFRFSALTYNAHRIHYDRGYATGVEGYPGLVVHGPLQAVALVELVRRAKPQDRVATFRFRGRRPLFDDGPVLLRGREDGARVELVSLGHDGQLAIEAEAELDS